MHLLACTGLSNRVNVELGSFKSGFEIHQPIRTKIHFGMFLCYN